jgi:probable addiction module antidote protein
MKEITTSLWDVVEYLKTEDDMTAYLEAAFEEGDPKIIATALGDIARAKGMSQIAIQTGIGT